MYCSSEPSSPNSRVVATKEQPGASQGNDKELEGSLEPETGSRCYDDLPEGLLKCILSRLPHVSRLGGRSVCRAWNRILSQQEVEQRAGPLWRLAVEKVKKKNGEDLRAPEEVEQELRCCTFDPSSGRKILLPVTFPLGWSPAAQGGIRGGGRSSLAAFFDYTGCQYWVGNPVHNQWEKVAEPPEFKRLSFGRQRFDLVAQGQGPGEFYIVQFQINESCPPRGCTSVVRDHTIWVIQVYSSREKAWRAAATVHPRTFRRLEHWCVIDGTVYFTGFDEEGDVGIWSFRVLDNEVTRVTPGGCGGFGKLGPFRGYFSSMRLGVKEGPKPLCKRLRIMLLGREVFESEDHMVYGFKFWELKLSTRARRWVVETDQHFSLDCQEEEFAREMYPDFSEEELDDDCEDPVCGIRCMSYILGELASDDEEEPLADQTERLGCIRNFCFREEKRRWISCTLDCPVSPWNELPFTEFLPCECCT